MSYRPWGLLDFALGLTNPKRWAFVGAIGTEERSLAAWTWLRELSVIEEVRFLEIHDNPSIHTARSNELLRQRRAEYEYGGGDSSAIHRFGLLASLYEIEAISEEVEALSCPVVLDITSLPKRFFFPLIRAFSRCSDLLLTYTSAGAYEENEPLSQLAMDWRPLPGFPQMRDGKEMLIASVGYMVEGLLEQARDINSNPAIKVLIPFPAPLSALRRSWESIWRLQSDGRATKFENYRVSATDMSLAFDRIVSLTRHTDDIPAFAPFGPKPISAAMCLFAMRPEKECAVYYPQPRIYHPDYSRGVGRVDGKPAVNAYWIKHEGKNLYATP